MRRAFVLWADDDPAVFDASRDLLDGLDCDLQHVVDGQSALDAIRLRRPDVLLLDLQMPPGDRGGISVLESLGDSDLCRRAIVVSNKASVADASDAARFGAEFLLKDHIERDLAARVQRIFYRSAAARGLLHEVVVRDGCNGPIGALGGSFWRIVCGAAPVLANRLQRGQQLRRIAYIDSYIRSPLAARCLYEVLSTLRSMSGGIGRDTHVGVTTSWEPPRERRPSRLFDGWGSEALAREVLQATLGPLGQVSVELLGKKADHRRELRLEWDDGALRVMPDKGLGFLRAAAARSLNCDLSASVSHQVAALFRLEFRVENNESYGSPIYIDSNL